LMMSV